jgi:WD40 repeat protein
MQTSLSLDIKTSTNIHFLNFNYNSSCFCIGTDKGYEIYTCNPIKRILNKQVLPHGVSYITMLNETNIVAYIKKDHAAKKNEEKKVIIYSESDSNIVGILEFKDIVRHILINISSIVISINDTVFIYSLLKLNLQHKIDINPSSKGLCAITACINDSFHLAVPSKIMGHVKILKFSIKNKHDIIDENVEIGTRLVDITTDSNPNIKQHISKYRHLIKAHQSSIRFIVFSQDGNYIATCSEKGTLIRIFNTLTKQLVKELRRGTDEAVINWMSISKDNKFLLCRSKKGTIHIFHTDYKETRNKNNKLMYVTGYINKYLGPLKKYMPKYIDSEWSFAQFNFQGSNTISTFSEKEPNIIYVISFEGIIFKINYNDINHVTVIKQSI